MKIVDLTAEAVPVVGVYLFFQPPGAAGSDNHACALDRKAVGQGSTRSPLAVPRDQCYQAFTAAVHVTGAPSRWGSGSVSMNVPC